MTIGQRIARKRKEAGLSQESLGAELGVSRQSIYKWESDAALPEIDKLVALSRRFGVTVGWLLGVEDAPEAEQPAADSGELTEAQLKMVEEIVDRYLAAQPQPRKRRKWPWVLAALVLICVAVNLFNRLDQLNHQYQNLSYAVSSVESSVNHQINGISDRVEEILKQQNDLTAEYRTELLNVSLTDNSADFSVFAVPKNYVEGMTAEFHIQEHGPGGGANVVPVSGTGRRFAVDAISCELTDEITLSVVFLYPDGTQETQVLDSFTGLYTQSLPNIDLIGGEELDYHGTLADGVLTLEAFQAAAKADWNGWWYDGISAEITPVSVAVGLFKNQRLLAWGEEIPQDTERWNGFEDFSFYQFAPVSTPFFAGDILELAAVVTDQYGRQTVCRSYFPPYTLSDDGENIVWADRDFNQDPDPAHWRF